MDPFYNSPEWRELRARVVQRDGNRCVLARFLGGRCHGVLHAHHIEPRAERPDLALDEDNCITVCAAHHPTLEAFRAFVSRCRRPLPPCRHRHRYPHARAECDRRRAAALGIVLEDDLAAAA